MVPNLIDDVQKIFEFQSFSYIRVCFTPTTIIFKWWDFNEFQLHVPIEKSMANPDIYDFSHHGSTSNSCEKLNLRCLGDKLCKKLPPAMYVHCTYILLFFSNSYREIEFYTCPSSNTLSSVPYIFCWCYRGGKSHIYPDSPLNFHRNM